jgi:hypothetical protein
VDIRGHGIYSQFSLSRVFLEAGGILSHKRNISEEEVMENRYYKKGKPCWSIE